MVYSYLLSLDVAQGQKYDAPNENWTHNQSFDLMTYNAPPSHFSSLKTHRIFPGSILSKVSGKLLFNQ